MIEKTAAGFKLSVAACAVVLTARFILCNGPPASSTRRQATTSTRPSQEPLMIWHDHREFIEALRASGDLVVIDEKVSWDLELGAISRLACERDGPAVWFTRIADYPEEHSIFVNPLATWRRVAICLGLKPDASVKEIYREYEGLEQKLIPPVEVKTGPCKEVILQGAEVDVFGLPAPLLHEGDGGRYIGTWDLVVSRDPESNWTNWGIYRFMVHGPKTLTGFPRPTSHLAASATVALGTDEAALAGGMRGAPVELVRCETNDLLVPATAEIVLEAEILPDRVSLEGPYGEYPGYRTGEMGNGILCRITAITHRGRPILTVDATGFKDDSTTITSMTGALSIKRRLARHGIEAADVYVPAEAAVHAAVVSVTRGGPEVCRKIVETLTSRRALLSKIFVVETDVDPFDMAAVMHAFATQCHPGRGIHVVHYEGGANTLTPCYSQDERLAKRGATVGFDCTWPPNWSREWEVPV